MDTRKIGVLLCFTLIIFFGTAYAQNTDDSEGQYAGWKYGRIQLVSGENLEGYLKFSNRLLTYKKAQVTRSLEATAVSGFDFFDSLENKRRSFLSIMYKPPYINKRSQSKNRKASDLTPWGPFLQFFEVLVELPSFSLLSILEPTQITISKTTYGGFYDPMSNTSTGVPIINYSQTESLFIFDNSKNVTLFLEETYLEQDRSLFDSSKTKRKIHDSQIFQKSTAPHYEKLERYAKKKRLTFKKKDDLIKILEYYKSIVTNI